MGPNNGNPFELAEAGFYSILKDVTTTELYDRTMILRSIYF